MHERTYEDGKVTREFVATRDTGFPPQKSRPSRAMEILREEMNRKHREALDDGHVVGVRTVMIDETALCPCGSGRVFSMCCVSKVVVIDTAIVNNPDCEGVK